MRNRLGLVLVTLAMLGIASSASAQGYGPPGGGYGPPPEHRVLRSGFILGGAIGLGGTAFQDCSACDTLGTGNFEFFLGGMLTPSLALAFDGAFAGHPFEDGSVLWSNTYTAILRGWLSPIFWLEGGVGIGQLQATDQYGFNQESHGGLTGLVAGGVELVQSLNFTLDLQLRLSAASYDTGGDKFKTTNFAILLGFNWY
jgi:hypothetical protein